MLLSLILIVLSMVKSLKCTLPVPLPASAILELVDIEEMLFCMNVISLEPELESYSSVMLPLILIPANLMGSPVPSLALFPVLIINCAII